MEDDDHEEETGQSNQAEEQDVLNIDLRNVQWWKWLKMDHFL